jgi:hypothetical protein
MDILRVFAILQKKQTSEAIEKYICKAMTGGLLDAKAKKQIEALL